VSIEWKEGMKFGNILNKKAGFFLNQRYHKVKKSWQVFSSFYYLDFGFVFSCLLLPGKQTWPLSSLI
jgi:hypothetical protein